MPASKYINVENVDLMPASNYNMLNQQQICTIRHQIIMTKNLYSCLHQNTIWRCNLAASNLQFAIFCIKIALVDNKASIKLYYRYKCHLTDIRFDATFDKFDATCVKFDATCDKFDAKIYNFDARNLIFDRPPINNIDRLYDRSSGMEQSDTFPFDARFYKFDASFIKIDAAN